MRALLLGVVAIMLLAGQDSSRANGESALPTVLWHAPRAMTVQDWICGPGGCDRAPIPPFQFVREDTGGTDAKLEVRDIRGQSWNIKFGAEVIPECFSSRFVTALGFLAEDSYFVASGKIEGVPKLHRARRLVSPEGRFTKGRFELRGQPDMEFLNGHDWSWTDNPFRGSHELAGLKIVMMLLSNWDDKDARDAGESNNGVFRYKRSGREELFYGVFDWGASLGRWGGMMRRDQSDCSGFAADTPRFVKIGRGNQLEWGYEGKHAEVAEGISADDVRWLLPYLRRITPEQLHAGLTASGATERQAGCWSGALQNRIGQLEAIGGSGS